MPHYSVVILPPDNIANEVKLLKQKLEQAIGEYQSVHSLAHITFNLFSGNEATVQLWEQYVQDFASRESAFEVCFDKAVSFSNGAFVIMPNEATYLKMKLLMKDFFQHVPTPAYGKSLKPHISIARKLKWEQAIIAQELISNVSLKFQVDHLTIRKFNMEAGQYNIYKRYYFLNSRSV